MATQPKYAVVYYNNYRKELYAGFNKYFDDYEEARLYAFSTVEKSGESEYLYPAISLPGSPMPDPEAVPIIREDQITDNNRPKSPYDSLIGYGASKDGYSTVFYYVVESFAGVENAWYEMNEDENTVVSESDEWVPRYKFDPKYCL